MTIPVAVLLAANIPRASRAFVFPDGALPSTRQDLAAPAPPFPLPAPSRRAYHRAQLERLCSNNSVGRIEPY